MDDKDDASQVAGDTPPSLHIIELPEEFELTRPSRRYWISENGTFIPRASILLPSPSAIMAPYMESLTPGTPPTSGEIPTMQDDQAKRATDKLAADKIAKASSGPEIDPSIKHGEDFSSHSVPFFNQFAMQPRPLRIITIGAGFSGLLIAHKLQHKFSEMQQYVSHSIYEQRSEIGGTWLVNTYPGVQCDVPSHIYVSHANTAFFEASNSRRRFHLTRTQIGLLFTPKALRSTTTSKARRRSGILTETWSSTRRLCLRIGKKPRANGSSQ